MIMQLKLATGVDISFHENAPGYVTLGMDVLLKPHIAAYAFTAEPFQVHAVIRPHEPCQYHRTHPEHLQEPGKT